jgi:Domain of unknown function (DUF4440)
LDVAARLLELEKRFWTASGHRDQYEENLASDAVHVFPGWGITDRERVLGAVADADPWQTFTIDDPQVVSLSEDSAAVVYTARAQRAGRPPYVAAMTSVYRRTGDDWELVVHQQTPLDEEP